MERCASSSTSRQPSKVGAVCGNAARTVLCGGRSAMIVPTATIWIVCEQTTTGSTIGGTQQDVLLLSNRTCAIISMAIPYEGLHMTAAKSDVRQGTLALMVLKTLQSMGSLHGYGIARRIEQTSGNRLAVNYGTLYPALLKLEQEGYISSEWGVSDNNRRAKYYKLTQAGRKQVEREVREWEQTNAILARFLAPESETQ
jgi:PadR family transcriptional regulator, regulatory protein PadR